MMTRIVSSQVCLQPSSKFRQRSLTKLKSKINQVQHLFYQGSKDSISKPSRTWLSRSNLQQTSLRLDQMESLSLYLLTSRKRYFWLNKLLWQMIRWMIKTKILLLSQINKKQIREIWIRLQSILNYIIASIQRYVSILILAKEEILRTTRSKLVLTSRKTTMVETSKSFSLSWTWVEMEASYLSTLSKVNRTISLCLTICRTCRGSMGSTTWVLARTASVG